MPLNPIAPFLNTWNTRVAQAQASGIPLTALAPVFQEDYKRLQQGGTPFTNDQYALATLSNYTQTPALHPVTQKPNWNPMGLIGRAVKDVGEIGKGIITLPKTVAHDISHINELPQSVAQGATDVVHGHVGQGLQEIANAPGLNEALLAASFLIPGGEAVTAGLKMGAEKAFAGVLAGGVAGQALTPEGRRQISQHPLIAALNILPAASETGLTAKLAEAAKATSTAAKVGQVMDNMGVSQRYREVWRTVSDARKQAHAKVGEFHAQATELFGRYAEDPKAMAEITRFLRSGDPTKIAEAEAKFPGFGDMKKSYDAVQQGLEDPTHFVRLAAPGGGTEVYSVDSLPAKIDRRLATRKDQLANQTEVIRTRTEQLAETQAKLDAIKPPSVQSITDRLKPEMDAELANDPLKSKLGPAVDALRNEDYATAARLLRAANRFDLADEVSRIRPETLQRIDLAQTLTRHQGLVDSAKAGAERLQSRVGFWEKNLQDALQRRPAARWHPDVTDEFHANVERWAQTLADPKAKAAALEETTKEIGDRYYGGKFEDGTPIFPPKALRQAEKDAAGQIAKWKAQGWNPSFVHSMSETQLRQLRYPNVGARAEPRISSYKEKVLGQSDEVNNVSVSLTHQQSEIFVQQLWRDAWHGYESGGQHVPGILDTFGRKPSDIIDELRKKRGLSLVEARRELAREWESPSRFASGPSKGIFAADDIVIPSSLAKNIDALNPSLKDPAGLKAVAAKGTRGYRFAVTGLSPQHVVHVVASGAMMLGMAMTDLPTILRSVGDARQMIKDGKVPVRFTQEASMLPDEEAMTFGAANKTAVRLYADHVSKAAHPFQRVNEAMQHFDDHVTQWYKTLDYVSQTKKGLDPERALYEVSKHFADHAGRSPLERSIFRTYVPFGSWTQHLIRYLVQFPADNPLRAAALANISASVFEDQKSGLPRDLQQMLFVGKNAFDIRSFNPFRDIGRTFTLAGFISQLNPAAEALFKTKGYNPITDSAELYPELVIDPNTGKLATKGQNAFRTFGEAFVPQVQGIEGLLGWSDQLRTLKKNDPKAYASTLARYLHFPWLPRNVDIPAARTKDQLNELRLAQTAVSKALKTGDFSGIEGFNVVPFQGKMVPPATIKALYAAAKKVNPNFTPNVVLR